MANTDFFQRIEDFRKATGRSVSTGVRRKNRTKLFRDDDPIDAHVICIALSVAARETNREDLRNEYLRTLRIIQSWIDSQKADS